MKNVTIEKSYVVAALIKNRGAHADAFAEAITGYRKAAIAKVEELLDKLTNGYNPQLYVHLTKPEDHTEDYERVLRMLTFETSDEVVLSAGDFSRYMEDDWDWQEQFMVVSTGYR